MTTGVLVFSRMSSSRLPGKAMMDVGGMPLLERVLRRAKGTGLPVALATSTEPEDDVLATLTSSFGCRVVRGSLDDVLGRAALAVETLGWDAFFRLCGDRPFFDVDEIRRWYADLVVDAEAIDFDLVTNTSPALPRGLSTELVNARAVLTLSQALELDLDHREHLTSYIYEHETKFRIRRVHSDHETDDNPHLAVDRRQDYEALSAVCSMDPDVHISTSRAIDLFRRYHS